MRKFYRQDLQNQYQNDPNFRRKVLKSEKQYAQIIQKAQKTNDWQKSINQSMLQIYLTQDNRTLYFFYGFMQPPPGRKKLQFIFYFLTNFRPEPQKQYTFIYFNHHTPSSEYYFQFSSIFSLLPISTLERLNAFILVKPYLYIKAWDYVGFANIHKVFEQNYQTIDYTVDLVKRINITPHQFVQFVPQQLSQEFPSNFKRKPSLSTYRINFQGQIMSQQQLKERRDFQNTIKALFTKQVYKLQNYELGEVGIPIILQVLVNYFKAKPEGLKIEGIFRKSVSLDEQTQIMEQLSQRNYGYILNNVGNPHIIACLIKKFFNNLKQPIIPFKLFGQLMNDQQASNKKSYYKSIIQKLPQLNTITLTFLIEFLKKDVIIHQKQSKMNVHNISICFSPAFMRSEKPSMADIVYAQKAVTVTEMLILDIDYFFGDEKARSKIFQSKMQMRKKDFKKTMRQQLNISIDQRPSEQFHCFAMSKQTQISALEKQIQDKINITIHENPHQTQITQPIINKQPVIISVQSNNQEEYKVHQPLQQNNVEQNHQNSDAKINFRKKMIQMVLNKSKIGKIQSKEGEQQVQKNQSQAKGYGKETVEDVSKGRREQ